MILYFDHNPDRGTYRNQIRGTLLLLKSTLLLPSGLWKVEVEDE